MVNHYPKLMIVVHWLTLLFVVAAYLSSGNPLKTGLQGQIHVITGMSVFILFLIRILFLFHYRGQLPQNVIINRTQEILFKIVRLLLYVSLFAVPLLGWLALSSLTDHFRLLGFNLMLFSSVSQNEFLGTVHQFLGNLFISLVGLHTGAALIHHFYLKDNVLKSILFSRDKRKW